MKRITGTIIDLEQFVEFCSKNNIHFSSQEDLFDLLNCYLSTGIDKSNISDLISFFKKNPLVIKRIDSKIVLGLMTDSEYNSKYLMNVNKKIVKNILSRMDEKWSNNITTLYVR